MALSPATAPLFSCNLVNQNQSMELTRHLVLVRHGESELNALSRLAPTYCGQVETPLNDVGRAQAREAGRRVAGLDYVQLQAAISSPLGLREGEKV